MSFIRVCLLKLGTCLYLNTHLYLYKLVYFEKKSHFFACDVQALGNQPMLVQTWHRVKYLCLFILLVHASNSVCNCTKLHCCALLLPHKSPWAKLFCFGDASSFLTMTGMTRCLFGLLYDVLFLGQQPQETGRPQVMDKPTQLGLFLFFIGSTMGYKHLCLIFGCTPTVCSRVNTSMLKLVVKKLKRHPLARDKIPDEEKMAEYAQFIHQ